MEVKRLAKVAKEVNIGSSTLIEFLQKKGMPDANPNSKISEEMYAVILKKYSTDKGVKTNADKIWSEKQKKDKNEIITLHSAEIKEEVKIEKEVIIKENTIERNSFKIVGSINLNNDKKPAKKEIAPEEKKSAPEQIKNVKQDKSEEIKKTPQAEKVHIEKTHAEKTHAEKTHVEKVHIEKTHTEKVHIEKTYAEKTHVEKVHIEKTHIEKIQPEIKIQEKNIQKETPELVNIINTTNNDEAKKEGSEKEFKIVGTIDLDNLNQKTRPLKKTKKEKEAIRKQKFADKKKVTPQKPNSENKSEPIKQERKHEKFDRLNKTDRPDRPQNRTDRPERKDKPVSQTDRPERQNRPDDRQNNNRPERQNRPDDRQNRPDDRQNRPDRNKNDRFKKPGFEVKEKVNKEIIVDKAIEDEEEDFLEIKVKKLSGPTVIGKIELPLEKKAVLPLAENKRRKKRKRIIKKIGKEVVKETEGEVDDLAKVQQKTQAKIISKVKKKFVKGKKVAVKTEVKEEDIREHIKETYAKLTANKQKAKTSAKHRKDKRDLVERKKQDELAQQEEAKSTIKVTEFVTANELATMMEISVTDVISTCMSLGLFVSINQRLDAETIALVADEFNFNVEFISVEIQEAIEIEEDKEEDLVPRSPIITVMGHVDHGKTSLLDFIRETNVIAGEAGGITQHIGAYKVKLKNGQYITFLDTPGHEAFTAMRARGAKVTDIVIVVVSADDSVMPQTIEAINHASAAGVPIIFAINKIDKPNANPDKIKKELAEMNYLIEEWGGKYQSADISAKFGNNVDELLELVLLEAEVLDLKANPNKRAKGTVLESTLDKGRGYLTTILVKSGTMKVGDIILAGRYTGRVKAMFNERNKPIDSIGPSEPALILGLDGAPQAGDEFNVMANEKEARTIANKREQLKREQNLRTNRHITLDEIGRRIAIGNFQELNIIVKGDFDGSVEALSDSLQKLSTPEIQVNIIHKAVGQISENDVTLAAASNAIIIGFQVRPSSSARRLAETEGIDIRLYSIIYDAIGELKDAMEGMLSPEIKEQIMGAAEIRETFKITKVGTIAGCMVKEGKIVRTAKIRLIRDGIVIYTGHLGSLRRFKDDVKEVKNGFECGLNIDRYNDIKEGDIIEAFENIEVKRTLK